MSESDLYTDVPDETGHIEYMDLVRKHWLTLNAIKEQLGCEAYESARDIWMHDINDAERVILWKAPTRGFGSVWNTWEREALRQGGEYETRD